MHTFPHSDRIIIQTKKRNIILLWSVTNHGGSTSMNIEKPSSWWKKGKILGKKCLQNAYFIFDEIVVVLLIKAKLLAE